MKGRRGFTLIELLVVIAIIGLLSSVVLASLNNARARARDARRISDLKQIQTALELYANSNGDYPTQGANTQVNDLSAVLAPAYIPALPQDPTNTGAYGYRYCKNAAGYVLLMRPETMSVPSTFCQVNNSTAPCWAIATYPACNI